MAFMDDYSLRPLRGGQVAVARSESGPLVAYRSVLTPAGGLTWSALDAGAKGSLAAVAGLCEFHQQALRHVNRPRCALSERQLAQLAAHRAYLLAMDFNIDIELAASRAIEQVLIACMGESVTFAIEQLLMLGLDLDASRDRVALQLVINLAESHGYSDRLRHLDIRPHAHAGLLLAADWLTSYATPSILNELSTLACHDDLARELLTIRSTRQFAPCT